MPTAKRARQKAARQQKRIVQQRRDRRRRLGRRAAFIGAGGAVVLVIALASAGVFSGSSPSTTASKKTSKTTTTTSSTTTTTAPTSSSTTTTSASTTTTAATATQAAANSAAVAAGCPATPKTRVNTLTWSSAPAKTITKNKTYTAAVKTTAGTFTISLDAKTAPTVVNNFVFLADQGYYKCNIFHRVIPGFMDQTGDPTGTGTGSPGYKFANQNVPKAYKAFDVAMANSGGTDTNGAQFFILATGGQNTLNSDLANGDKYALFGSVTKGQTVVTKINQEGNSTASANGVPPKVTQRILSITITTS